MATARGGKSAELVAIRLRHARTTTGLTQRELGIRAGMTAAVASARMNQYEQGRHMPDVATLTKIGRVLGVPLAYFFADDELAEVIIRFAEATIATRRAVLRQLRE